MQTNVTAIAKNENRFIIEWLAHYLTLGFDTITVYDNESSDGMSKTLDKLSRAFPVKRIHWPHQPRQSPQITAYADSLKSGNDWIAFFDLDEFLVFSDPSQSALSFLSRFGEDVSAIGVNWISFGSSGRVSKRYGLVRDAFKKGPPLDFHNNKHIKTIARPSRVKSMGIHAAKLISGRYVAPSGCDLDMSEKEGISDIADHSVAVLNHYQIKSREDFEEKIARGRAGRRTEDAERYRTNGEAIWRHIDKNEIEHRGIDANRTAFIRTYDDLLASLV